MIALPVDHPPSPPTRAGGSPVGRVAGTRSQVSKIVSAARDSSLVAAPRGEQLLELLAFLGGEPEVEVGEARSEGLGGGGRGGRRLRGARSDGDRPEQDRDARAVAHAAVDREGEHVGSEGARGGQRLAPERRADEQRAYARLRPYPDPGRELQPVAKARLEPRALGQGARHQLEV